MNNRSFITSNLKCHLKETNGVLKAYEDTSAAKDGSYIKAATKKPSGLLLISDTDESRQRNVPEMTWKTWKYRWATKCGVYTPSAAAFGDAIAKRLHALVVAMAIWTCDVTLQA